MQRANIKGPPAPPSLARPRNTHSSPPFFTTLPTLLLPLLPFLFFLRFCFFSVFSIFVRGAAFAQQTRGRGEKRERETRPRPFTRDAKARGNVLKPRSFSPDPAFFQSFYGTQEEAWTTAAARGI